MNFAGAEFEFVGELALYQPEPDWLAVGTVGKYHLFQTPDLGWWAVWSPLNFPFSVMQQLNQLPGINYTH